MWYNDRRLRTIVLNLDPFIIKDGVAVCRIPLKKGETLGVSHKRTSYIEQPLQDYKATPFGVAAIYVNKQDANCKYVLKGTQVYLKAAQPLSVGDTIKTSLSQLFDTIGWPHKKYKAAEPRYSPRTLDETMQYAIRGI